MPLSHHLLTGLLDVSDVQRTLLETELEHEKKNMLDGLLWGGVVLIVAGLVLALFCGLAMQWLAPRQSAIPIGLIALLVLLVGLALTHWAYRHLGDKGTPHNKSML